MKFMSELNGFGYIYVHEQYLSIDILTVSSRYELP